MKYPSGSVLFEMGVLGIKRCNCNVAIDAG